MMQNADMNATPFLLALGWGLAGGFSHCIGMCGVFVVAYAGVPNKDAPRRIDPVRHVLFHGGRLATLAALGALAGTVGNITRGWAHAQGIMSIAAGVLLVGLALGFAGLVPQFKIPEPDIMGAGGGVLRRAFVRVLRSRSVLKPALTGVFVGLLPCMLTYQALFATLTLGPGGGALLMLLFGLGTVPGLLMLGVFGNAVLGGVLMRASFRTRMTQISAALMAALGLAFVWRGVQGL